MRRFPPSQSLQTGGSGPWVSSTASKGQDFCLVAWPIPNMVPLMVQVVAQAPAITSCFPQRRELCCALPGWTVSLGHSTIKVQERKRVSPDMGYLRPLATPGKELPFSLLAPSSSQAPLNCVFQAPC